MVLSLSKGGYEREKLMDLHNQLLNLDSVTQFQTEVF